MRSIVKHIRQSLSWKLSLGILLMAIPIFLLALGLLFVQSRNKVKREATKHAASVVNTTMQHITRYMNFVETATDLTAWDVIANLQPDSLFMYSNFVVSFNSHIDGCSISLEPGTFPQYGRYFSVYTVREPDTVRTVIEEQYEYFEKVWYKEPKHMEKACWAVYYDEGDSLELTLDGMIASYSKPLYRSEKDFVGIISTDLSLLRLSKIITTETPYEDSYFFMTGEEGRYFLHPDTAQLFKKTIFSDADPNENTDIISLGYQMTTGQQGSMSVRINGEPCIVSYQPVPGTDWSLALVCPERTILQNYNLLAFILIPLLVIGLLFILIFCGFTVANAIRPLYQLSDNLQHIADGHYDGTIARSDQHDVVGRLQNSFAAMQESLSRHVKDIQQMNAEATRRNEGKEDIGQPVVVMEDGALITDEGEAPVGSRHRLVADDAGFAINPDTHAALLAGGHLMAQGEDVGILIGVGIAEDGVGEELRAIGVKIVTAFVARHEEIGVVVWFLSRDDL